MAAWFGSWLSCWFAAVCLVVAGCRCSFSCFAACSWSAFLVVCGGCWGFLLLRLFVCSPLQLLLPAFVSWRCWPASSCLCPFRWACLVFLLGWFAAECAAACRVHGLVFVVASIWAAAVFGGFCCVGLLLLLFWLLRVGLLLLVWSSVLFALVHFGAVLMCWSWVCFGCFLLLVGLLAL